MSANLTQRLDSLRSAIAGALLVFYKHAVSPAFHAITPGACPFQPTCSEYAAIALAEHGILRGGLMTVRRLVRCHPLHHGGFDPVPRKRGAGHFGYSGTSPISCVAQTEDR
ncbi:MAG TPA: membrane protein insertion efficiency factor YidD [Acidobacteriaceae bacterium]|nr:membrane protein insertion efficiency factor YidD [Acidobacteriaceae bacterium]